MYHLFLSLVPALLSLRDELEATHNNVKAENVMVRYAPETCAVGRPEFVFVDLGMAYGLKSVKNQSSDAKDLLGLVMQMAEQAPERGDVELEGFKRMLDGERSGARSRFDVDKDLVGIFGKWKDVAEKRRDMPDIAEVEMAVELLERAGRKKGKVTDEDTVDAASVRI